MRYTKAINVWAPGVEQAIRQGNLRLQPGQWVKCGEQAKPSRWVGISRGGSLWAVHPSPKVDMERFSILCKSLASG